MSWGVGWSTVVSTKRYGIVEQRTPRFSLVDYSPIGPTVQTLLFVGGAPFSGTSLLTSLLVSSSAISVRLGSPNANHQQFSVEL